jgi:hypothetical protein
MSKKEEILKRQELRLKVLKGIYTEVKGNMENSIRDFETIEELYSKTEKTELIGILMYLFEKDYIKYIESKYRTGVGLSAIQITAKGIELIEGIDTGGNVSKFEDDFSKSVLNVSFNGDLSNSNVNFGNENTQTISINENDIDSIMQLIEKLIKENPNKAELVEAKAAVIEEKKKGELSKFFLKGIGSTIKQFVTDVSVGVLTTGAIHMLGL